ncbi:MAG: prepilin-type N-terminal cleavage/methylation domain-containing protein [Planctomycetota bacterium]|jgi:prepilin-type N-terminal cleavage/methylation domain-containing protein
MKSERAFTLIEVLVVVLIVSVLCMLLLPAFGPTLRAAREVEATRLIQDLESACLKHHFEFGWYPCCHHVCCQGLVERLSRPGRRGVPFFEFRKEMLNAHGDIRNPVWPDREIVHYLNNVGGCGCVCRSHPSTCLGHIGSSSNPFELWARGCRTETPGEDLPVSRREPDLVKNWP